MFHRNAREKMPYLLPVMACSGRSGISNKLTTGHCRVPQGTTKYTTGHHQAVDDCDGFFFGSVFRVNQKNFTLG